jgi:hypothetical protein
MTRLVVLLTLAASALAPAARAQPAMPASALGEPLPDSSMPVGSVTVRVIAGTPAVAVPDAEVKLTVNGVARAVKTDSSGRAAVRDLPPGARVVAQIIDDNKQLQVSKEIVVPPAGGVRVMLSTKPFIGAEMPAPGAASPGGGDGMKGAPEARSMSGQPRPDSAVPPGTYQVRVTYNSLVVREGKATDPQPPKGEVVTLVGYHSDNSIAVRTLPVDASGYAVFSDLDVTGNTTYFAMARLPRGGGVDRLSAVPVQPDSQVGAKVILSGEQRTSSAAPVDDTHPAPTPAGHVRVLIDGAPTEEDIVLYDASTRREIGRAKPARGAPDPRAVRGGAQIEPAADLPGGAVHVRIHGGPGTMDIGLPEVPVRIIPADALNSEGVSSKSGPDGTVQLTAPRDKQLKAVFTVNGKDLVSEEFFVGKTGVRIDVAVSWEAEGRLSALVAVPYRPELVVYAETSLKGKTFRSQPAQLVAGTGVAVVITVYPRVLVNFSMRAVVEDELLAVRGTYTIENYAWAPYRAGPDGLVIELPKGFKGGRIAEEHQTIASIAPTEGVRIVRPLPPGRTQFIVGFSLGSKDGDLQWTLPLPHGTFQSGMEIRLADGMEVKPVGAAQGRVASGRDGAKWFVLDSITISPGQSMVMTMSGLPSDPPWRYWVPRIVGAAVLGMMAAGVLLAVLAGGRRGATGDRTLVGPALRAKLLDELVELERTGRDRARRDQLVAELERTWRS